MATISRFEMARKVDKLVDQLVKQFERSNKSDICRGRFGAPPELYDVIRGLRRQRMSEFYIYALINLNFADERRPISWEPRTSGVPKNDPEHTTWFTAICGELMDRGASAWEIGQAIDRLSAPTPAPLPAPLSTLPVWTPPAAPPAPPAPKPQTVPLGTAKWLTDATYLERFRFRKDKFRPGPAPLSDGRSDGQIWIGEAITPTPFPLGYGDDRHVCLVSGNRGGKGTSVIVPNLCFWPGSCIVIDPKGENATITAARRGSGSAYAQGMGQSVRVLDPFNAVRVDPSLKGRFNPLDTIDVHGDYAVDDAALMAAALIPIQSRNDPFFEESARSVTKAVILHVLTAPEFEGRRNLISVWKLIAQGDWINTPLLQIARPDRTWSPFAVLWQKMAANPAFNGVIAGEGTQLAEMSEKTRNGIMKPTQNALAFIGTAPMSRVLEASDFSLSDLKLNPDGLSLFVTLPQRYMATHCGWVRLMVDLATNEMERIQGRPATGYKTLFVLDEFAGLRWMERMEEGAAQAAGAGIKYMYVLQNLTQLKKIYSDSWETFLGNASLKLFFSIEDNFTRSYISQQVGDMEVKRGTESGSNSRSKSQTGTLGRSQSETSGDSRTDTTGRSSTSGTSHTRGRSISEGSSFSTGYTSGESGGATFNSGGGSSQRGWSSSLNSSAGRSSTEGASTSDSRSTSKSDSTSTANGTSRSQTGGTSESASRGTSESDSYGWNESIHKRPLMNPDEVGRLLARVDEPSDPDYPGHVLALIPGQQPILARRVNYFESDLFLGHYDPHPEHEPPPTIAELVARARSNRPGGPSSKEPPGRPTLSRFLTDFGATPPASGSTPGGIAGMSGGPFNGYQPWEGGKPSGKDASKGPAAPPSVPSNGALRPSNGSAAPPTKAAEDLQRLRRLLKDLPNMPPPPRPPSGPSSGPSS